MPESSVEGTQILVLVTYKNVNRSQITGTESRADLQGIQQVFSGNQWLFGNTCHQRSRAPQRQA